MKEEYICEKCGHVMIDRSFANSIHIECPNCHWGWATTTYDPIADDNTDYEIYLCSGNEQTMDNIKLIAEIMGCNFLHAKKALSSDTNTMIYKARNESVASMYKAQRVQAIASRLKEGSLHFLIVPEFPYEY